MSISALVIGYGSIGKRHTDVLSEMDGIGSIAIVSSQTNLPFLTIESLEDILGFNPDYVIIASPTTQHLYQLEFMEEHLEGKKILVEKPLFDSFCELEIKNNQVYVGYNLRFHPLLKKIKKFISGRPLWNLQVFCGSYLPDWRPERDYRQTYSAKKNSGGGVLLDLSHELDYVQWLAGNIELKHAVSEKVSVLDIDSDDLLLLSGKTEGGAHIHISQNYFTRNPLRQILIDGKGISIRADLVTNLLSVVEDGEASDYSYPELERNNLYRAQHQAVLEDNRSCICTYDEGLETMRLIDRIRSFGNK